jgi:predicted RNA-binding Zn-ribbon protein involved in translation (DUF1610 family)
MSDFKLVEDKIFDQLCDVDKSSSDEDDSQGFCSSCNVSMNFIEETHTYECPECHEQKEIECGKRDYTDDKSNIIGVIKMNSKSYRRCSYNNYTDYRKNQHRVIFNKLENWNQTYGGPKLPKHIINRVSSLYYQIQLTEIGDEDRDRRFIRRRDTVNEILGALIYHVCIDEKSPRRKSEIVDMINKSEGCSGIAGGDSILRELVADGKVQLKLEPLTIEDENNIMVQFTERFLESLGINKQNYKSFVCDMVNASKRKKIGISSLTTSKIIGSIWVLIQHEKVDISKETLMNTCDNIRATTFLRFAAAIEDNILKFIKVFEDNGIKHGFEGRIVKKKKIVPPANQ